RLVGDNIPRAHRPKSVLRDPAPPALLRRAPRLPGRHAGFPRTAAPGPAPEQVYSFAGTPGKLPKTVVPTHYAIELEPSLEGLTFAGTELVDIEVREPTARIVLNAVYLAFVSATIDNGAQIAAMAPDAAAETVTLT